MPRLSGTLLSRNSLGVRVPEVTQVLIKNCQVELMVGSVPAATREVEASDEGNQTSQVRIPARRVCDDALLVVRVGAGGKLVL